MLVRSPNYLARTRELWRKRSSVLEKGAHRNPHGEARIGDYGRPAKAGKDHKPLACGSAEIADEPNGTREAIGHNRPHRQGDSGRFEHLSPNRSGHASETASQGGKNISASNPNRHQGVTKRGKRTA